MSNTARIFQPLIMVLLDILIHKQLLPGDLDLYLMLKSLRQIPLKPWIPNTLLLIEPSNLA